jgi:predicted DNA-binding antitoxin AbrB/MazE fold protein
MNNQMLSGDFNINLMPSSKIILYDTLFIPWTAIKDKVPEAIDAYTSPSKDIALIVTTKYILIYTIENGALSSLPIQKVKLKEGESVIMSEWSTGDYVYNWERCFYKNEVKEAE